MAVEQKLFIVIVLVLSMATIVYGTSSSNCCPTNQILLRRGSAESFCYDRENNLNTTSNISKVCNITGFVKPTADMTFSVNSYNQLVVRLHNFEVEYEPGSFCIANSTTVRDKNFTRVKPVAVVCYEEEVRVIDDEIFGYCMFLSGAFLFATAGIYLAFEELRDLLGKCIINFCISLGIGLSILAAMKLIAYIDMDMCAARGFLAYFFILAAFFWMNAISIQILLSIKRPSVLNYGWKEFFVYAFYAWGTPAMLATAMAVVNFIPGDHLKPGLGLNHCWFFNTTQQWWYMYSVMTILILINIGIFIYISVLLWRQPFSSSHIKAMRYKFNMTMRLFFVMGVPWVFEMVGSIMKSHFFWELLDLMNSLQGILVFLVLVVFRKKVVKMMYRRGWLDCISGPVERCLAVGEDQENVVQHTIGMSLDESKMNGNGIK